MYKIGIVGCGSITQLGHIPNLLTVKKLIEVEALCDISQENLAICSKMLDLPLTACYTDMEKMLDSVELDFVIIALPSFLHLKGVEAAIKRNVAILLEKPLAGVIKDGEKIVELVNASNVKFSMVHNYKTALSRLVIAEAIKQNRIGKPFFAKIEAVFGGAWESAWKGNPSWYYKKDVGGGILRDFAYHLFYMFEEYIGSNVVSVFAKTANFKYDWETGDFAIAVVTFEDGSIGHFTIGNCAVKSRRNEEIHGENGSIQVRYLDDGQARATLYTEKDEEELDISDHDIWGYAELYKQFIDYLEGNGQAPGPIDQSLRIMRAIDAAYKSNEMGMEVDIHTI